MKVEICLFLGFVVSYRNIDTLGIGAGFAYTLFFFIFLAGFVLLVAIAMVSVIGLTQELEPLAKQQDIFIQINRK